ncbi:MAG: hypothetical protein ACLVI9_02145 [Anaerostipes hadrus]
MAASRNRTHSIRRYDSSYQSNHKEEKGKEIMQIQGIPEEKLFVKIEFASTMHCLRKLEQHQNRD